MQEREWYSIEEHNGQKMVHYHGFTCPYWRDDLWSFIDFTWCLVPLEEVVAEESGGRYTLLDDAADCVQQYQDEVDEKEAERTLEMYYGHADGTSSPGVHLKLEDLTMDTPFGNYWFGED